MTRKVLWSATARADLLSIGRFIARDNPTAARTVVARLRAVGEALGEVDTGRFGRVSGTREKRADGLPYILAYEIVLHDVGEAVAILHVIHGARDWRPEEWPSD